MWINAGTLFAQAREAFNRLNASGKGLNEINGGDAHIAIVFGCIACEAFINELGHLARQGDVLPVPDTIKNLGHLLDEADRERSSLLWRYHLAKLALTGATFDKGGQPFQDFAILVELRNALVHLKFDKFVQSEPNDLRIEPPAVIGKLRPLSVLAEFKGSTNVKTSWTNLICTTAMARWACNAASAVVKDVAQSVPAGTLRHKVEILYFSYGAFDPA